MADTYSFGDIDFIITHPSRGQYSLQGEGGGSITVAQANDVTTHDTAADGRVMVSKIATNNGNITINIQQISPLNRWMEQLYVYLRNAPSNEWAVMTIMVYDRINGERVTCNGVSFQRRAERTYQAQGQQRSWQLMTTDITYA